MAKRSSNLPTLRIPEGALLPDNKTFTNRFEIRSETSSSVYRIAQSKSGRWWACSCRGYVFARKDGPKGKTCKHLRSLGLAVAGESFLPVEVAIEAVRGRKAVGS